jgi:hypothetical protein
MAFSSLETERIFHKRDDHIQWLDFDTKEWNRDEKVQTQIDLMYTAMSKKY